MTEVPGPKGIPLLGNVNDVDPSHMPNSLWRLAETYGEIFHLNLLGRSAQIINSVELLHEISDERKFAKRPSGALDQVRNGVGDGLFTAFPEEENWELAHRILMPKFGPLAIKRMFGEMHEIAAQMVTKIAREGSDHIIDPVDYFTRLTLDSIALCAMGVRFNSYYRESMHPFVDAMIYFLIESGKRSLRPEFINNTVYRTATAKYQESIDIMVATAREAINERREHPVDKEDLLNALLHGKDPKTGKSLPEDNMIKNAITFLIAGHETTSGTLSFLFVEFLKNPAAMQKAQKEIDQVIGTGPITSEHTSKLPYVSACLRETLRLHPTATTYSVVPTSTNDADFPIFLGKEKYIINKGDSLTANLPKIHTDPKVYGEDALEFRPERMLDEEFNKLPAAAWKPFGNGSRACIGRAFAWEEAHIIVAMLLQNFNFTMTDPSYVLKTKSTLTIKPSGFYMRASPREGVDPMSLERRLWGGKEEKKVEAKDRRIEEASTIKKKPMAIYYGSNAGTCESLAQSLASSADGRGYNCTVEPLDTANKALPNDRPAIIITSSYEGEPPDNAAQFYAWLTSLEGDALKGVKYAVFGCGNRDWRATYQKIPSVVDHTLKERGGTQIAPRGVCDAADNTMFDDFDEWTEKQFWPGLAKTYGEKEVTSNETFALDLEIEAGTRVDDLRQDVQEGLVISNKTLTAPGEPEKRHIEIQLPSGMTYTAGDYLAVLPINNQSTVKSVMARFKIPFDARVTIKPGQHTFLPSGKSIPIHTLLSTHVELNNPATQKHVHALAANCAPDSKEKEYLESLTPAAISKNNITLLSILNAHRELELPFAGFLGMLSPLRVRQYSISSSPLHDPARCTLTYGVLSAPSHADPSAEYLGAASTYLADLAPGSPVSVAVKPSSAAFHPPLDIAKTPVIMVAAGAGLAPFRGFVQERAAQKAAGRALAPALLFVGCRDPHADALHRSEFKVWQDAGVVDVRYAFSRAPDRSEGCRYVHDRLWHDIREASALWDAGARLFVCGSAKVGEGVREKVIKAYVHGLRKKAEAEGEAVSEIDLDAKGDAWFESVRRERYASDVFG